MQDNSRGPKSPNLIVSLLYASAAVFMLAALLNLIEIKRDLKSLVEINKTQAK